MHRYGEVQYHEREYDLRDGVLRRSVRWTSPTGRAVKVSSVRMVSFTQRAAEVGQLQLAYDYLGEAALLDLDDLEHNVRDGGHLAALAGTWTALVAGFGSPRRTTARSPSCRDCQRGSFGWPSTSCSRSPPARRGEGDGSDVPPARRLVTRGVALRRRDHPIGG